MHPQSQVEVSIVAAAARKGLDDLDTFLHLGHHQGAAVEVPAPQHAGEAAEPLELGRRQAREQCTMLAQESSQLHLFTQDGWVGEN